MRCDGMASPFFPPSFLLQMQTPHEEEEESHLPSFLSPLLPNTTPCANVQDFHGLAALLGKRNGSHSACEEVNGEEDLSDDCSAAAGEKKRRLNLEQVRTLERSFEMGNKLEPERKIQLARALGLQPRQVAIWFQNRRARWKTKQLEKDYGELKRQMEAIKEENDALQAQNKKLEAEIVALRGREASEPINLNKDQTEGSCSNRSDNSCDINLDISRTPATESPVDAYHVRPFFQPVRPAASVAQLLQYPSSRPEEPHCPKVEHGVAGQDESFCNMFSGLDDQPGFCWAWSEQHSFH